MMPDRSLYDIAYHALRRIARQVAMHSHRTARTHGLTTPQVSVLREVLAEGDLAVSRIAERTSLSHATVSGILDRLERDGLVTRVRDTDDRRRVKIRLTRAGREAVRITPPLLHDEFIRAFGELPEWERMYLVGALEKIAVLMDSPVDGPGPHDHGTPPGGGSKGAKR